MGVLLCTACGTVKQVLFWREMGGLGRLVAKLKGDVWLIREIGGLVIGRWMAKFREMSG
jgi:hypothetical protein